MQQFLYRMRSTRLRAELFPFRVALWSDQTYQRSEAGGGT